MGCALFTCLYMWSCMFLVVTVRVAGWMRTKRGLCNREKIMKHEDCSIGCSRFMYGIVMSLINSYKHSMAAVANGQRVSTETHRVCNESGTCVITTSPTSMPWPAYNQPANGATSGAK